MPHHDADGLPADRQLSALFDDLEQQAEGLALADREVEIDDRARDEYAEVDLLSRLHASVGASVVLSVQGVGQVPGRVSRVGRDWCLVTGPQGEPRLVHLRRLVSARGLSEHAVPAAARSVLSLLPLTSCLRRMVDDGDGTGRGAVLGLVDGSVRRGELHRVGADFVELWHDGAVTVVPLAAVATVTTATGG